jgi:plastocyanin
MNIIRFMGYQKHAVIGFASFTAISAVLTSVTLAGLGSAAYTISQKGRTFQPSETRIQQGGTISFVNDDGDLVHHAYLETDDFSFDTGDQAPGSRIDTTFPKSGIFIVMCAVHPKMKLIVRVD